MSSSLNGVEEGGVVNAAKGGPRAGGSERITRCEIETDSHRRAKLLHSQLGRWIIVLHGRGMITEGKGKGQLKEG